MRKLIYGAVIAVVVVTIALAALAYFDGIGHQTAQNHVTQPADHIANTTSGNATTANGTAANTTYSFQIIRIGGTGGLGGGFSNGYSTFNFSNESFSETYVPAIGGYLNAVVKFTVSEAQDSNLRVTAVGCNTNLTASAMSRASRLLLLNSTTTVLALSAPCYTAGGAQLFPQQGQVPINAYLLLNVTSGNSSVSSLAMPIKIG
ncbi:MAG: hypothetical protein KGH58_03535 [Candidatus Micrarchaeota archaeon]|nr:hypothetical protein [Candidatus Micrarchaeota archaeon]